MATDCVFCGIANGDVPATIVYSDEDTLAFEDIQPQAPVHLLVITKKHLADVTELGADPEAGAALLKAIGAVAAQQQLTAFRTILNTGAAVGQSVFHVHAHLLAGRPMAPRLA